MESQSRKEGLTSIMLKHELDPERGPLIQQLVNLIRDAIRDKDFKMGDRITPTRKLAEELGISRGTVTTAVETLIAEGLLESKVGSGVFVAEDAQYIQDDVNRISARFICLPKKSLVPDTDDIRDCLFDFRPCRPSTERFPRNAWKQCIAKAARVLPSSDYGDPRGDLRLRESIAGYLRRSRGLSPSVDEIIITNGAIHAMHLLGSLYLNQKSTVIVEDPGYPLARQTFQATGAKILTRPVDDDGLVVEALPASAKDIQMIYVTPSHQFPIGSRLSLGRRRALLDWAQRNGVVVVEDDYDGEFRFDVAPLAPLAAMDNNCVYYCGTFSKILFPGIRIGYAVAPKPLIDKLANYRQLTEYAANEVIQSALFHFINEGHFEKYILRMRREYSIKRQAVSSSLTQWLPNCSLTGLQSGLHGVLELGEMNCSAKDVAVLAEREGILIPPLQRYDYKANSNRNALVLGFAASTVSEIETGIERLGELVT